MPSVLFINRVYPPDSGATGRVLEQVAATFVRAGWRVTVLSTSGDKAPPGIVDASGTTVVRVGAAFSKSSLIARAVGYALMIPSLLLKALRLPRADVVVTMTDPPMLAALGPPLVFFKGSSLIHWAQDIYPEVAEEAGVFSKGGIMSGVLRAISTSSLKAHDLVVSLGRCMSERFSVRGIPAERVRVIPNIGMERDIVPCRGGNNPFRVRNGIAAETLLVMYSGNLGRAHEFGTVLETARLLEEGGEQGILFLFVGEGPSLSLLKGNASSMGLRNVRFLPSQPGRLISESLGAADLHLVTMRRGMSGLVVPSKFYGVLAAARPCLFIGPSDSEVARVIREVGCGEVVGIGEARALAAVILAYRDDPGLMARQGKLGHEWLVNQPDAGSEFLHCAGEVLGGITKSDS